MVNSSSHYHTNSLTPGFVLSHRLDDKRHPTKAAVSLLSKICTSYPTSELVYMILHSVPIVPIFWYIYFDNPHDL